MSDLETVDAEKHNKRARPPLSDEWQVSEDGFSVRRSFPISSAREASRLAGRVVAMSVKKATPIEVKCDGTTLLVSIPRSGSLPSTRQIDRGQRGLAQRLDRFLSEAEQKPDTELPPA